MHVVQTTEHSTSDPTWTGPAIASYSELTNLL